ncbi:MAG: iron ABC transporter permease [Phoenicibacter congonensis]|uniref:Iron ABC transporter permease n=1 Tax=Phoenicibacter congonensis TaxID=1944646 RepID=A0AA43UB07_9ACTN|nr:iron ABC transporter permease [Phoenicibacter congonensis]
MQVLSSIRRQPLKLIFLALVIVFSVGYIILPLVETIAKSLIVNGAFSLQGYVDYFSTPANITVLTNTFTVGICCVLTCGTLGTLLAVYMRYFCKHGKTLLQILLMSPVMIPGIVIVIAFTQMYGESGIITQAIKLFFNMDTIPYKFEGLGAIVLVITYTQYVYFFINMNSALAQIDASTVDAAKSLGAGKWKVFKDAILPPLLPAICISSMTTFVSAIGSLSAPTLVGGNYRVLVKQIADSKLNFDMFSTSLEVTILLIFGVVVTAFCSWLSARLAGNASTRHVNYQPDFGKQKKGLRVLFVIFVFLQVAMILAQVFIVFWMSFQSGKAIMTQIIPHDFTLDNYVTLFTNRRDIAPLFNSLEMAAIAVLASTLISLPTAYFRQRVKGKAAGAFAGLAQLSITVPWCIPASVVAVGLIVAFNVPNVFAFGTTLVGKFEILPLAYTIIALPIMLNTSRIALGSMPENAEEAARSLGAGAFRTFRTVVLPMIIAGILSGAILVFVKMMGEYTMSSLLYGVFNRPISVSIITNMQEYYLGIAMALGASVILICTVLLFLILKLDKRKLGLTTD